ncbi:MAG TPA: protein kinase [Chloroflexia bacterium]|nr:protein kinase [Chloroflexia bacterium]
MQDTLVGHRLGKYQIESLIGRGGMAAVYRAHDTALNRAVAIKVLEPSLSVDPNAVERFKREAVTAANLEHPSIVRVYDVEQSGNLHYIAMRYVQGTTLRDILRDNGSLPPATCLKMIEPIAAALHYAHLHGVIHRDVKPGNILVEPDGTVLLTDFGIARAADNAQSSLTAHGHVMGTADYLAPEQISGRPAGAASDVYSLGIVLYEMLTGVTPFVGENTAAVLYKQVHEKPPPLHAINSRLPSDLQPIMDRALAKNPAMRYADPTDLTRALAEILRWSRPNIPSTSSRNKPGVTSTGLLGHAGASPSATEGERRAASNGAQLAVVDSNPTPRNPPSQMIAPSRTGARWIPFVASIALLAAGAILVVSAIGLFANKASGDGGARFKAPGESVYAGPKRTDNGPDISIPQALIPPVIDGDLSDWQGAQPGPFGSDDITYRKVGRDWGGPSDLSASFYFAWDDTNFYVAGTITDNLHVQTARTRGYDLYKGDDVELWFDTDLAGDFAVSEANADDYQLGLSPGDFAGLAPEAVFWNPDRSSARDALVRVAAQPRTDNNGYIIEAAVPWQAMGAFRPHAGSAIGFAASAGDNDQRDTPEQELMTSTGPRLQYRQPFTFGNLLF